MTTDSRDTPRTDALLKSCSPRPDGVAADALIRLARQLERELAQARAAAFEEAAKLCEAEVNKYSRMGKEATECRIALAYAAKAIRAAGGRG